MPRGRPKTLPPSRFVGVLIPISMLDKVEDVRREGQKQCSAYSFSEAIRDVLAKGLDVTWKPVDHGKVQPKVEQKKEHSFEEMWSAYRQAVNTILKNRPKGTSVEYGCQRAASFLDIDLDNARRLYFGFDTQPVKDMLDLRKYVPLPKVEKKEMLSFLEEVKAFRNTINRMVEGRRDNETGTMALKRIAEEFEVSFVLVRDLYRENSSVEQTYRLKKWYDKRCIPDVVFNGKCYKY
jgi:hypothetical protein